MTLGNERHIAAFARTVKTLCEDLARCGHAREAAVLAAELQLIRSGAWVVPDQLLSWASDRLIACL